MKKLALLLLAAVGFQFATAQSSRVEEAANYAADYICTCVNKIYSDVDNDVRDVIMAMATMTEAEFDEYVGDLSPDLQERIVEQSLLMADEEKTAAMEECNQRMVANLESKYADVSDDNGTSEDDIMLLILSRLESREKCTFAYFLILVGLGIDEENPEDPNLYQNNNNNNNNNNQGGGTDGQ